jgi:hypothetical protein
MDALFFRARRDEALGVAASDDLPSEPVTDALRIENPSALASLSRVLGVDTLPRPLRDATCRSFPVWELGPEMRSRIAELDDAEVDDVAEQWQKDAETSLDADLYELAGLLTDLRETLRGAAHGESIFVLLEERAW